MTLKKHGTADAQVRGIAAEVDRAIQSSDWEAARRGLVILLDRQPGDAASWIQLSYVESYLGHYRKAREAALRASRLGPGDIDTAKDVLARLRTFNLVEDMRRYLAGLGPVERLPIMLLLSAAAHFSSINEQTTALRMLDQARNADPDFPPTLVARAQVLMYLGRLQEAEADVTRALRRAPEIAQAWWLLSKLKRQTPETHHVDAMRRELARPGRRPGDVALLGHGLHKALDDMQHVDEAWHALDQGNRAKRATLDYRTEDSRALVDALVAMRGRDAADDASRGETRPIFIIGMHRSGTTLLEQMLDGHSAVHGAGELYDFTSAMRYVTDHHCQRVIDATIVARASAPGFDFAEVGQRYLDGIAWRLDGKRVLTDKLPSNFLNAGFICQALPQARLLHMVRDPVEVCFSNLRELFSGANPYSYDQIELADFYLEYHRLMAHWREAFPGRILDIRYDRLVRDPEAVIREVCDFCGLDFEPEMLAIANRKRGVSTASAVQVREGIQVRDVPKWKPYEAHLQPLIRRLREGGVLEER